MEYKVLTKEDRRWSGKFSPESLEHTLNSYAVEGWHREHEWMNLFEAACGPPPAAA